MKRPRLPARLEAAFWEKSRGLRRRLRDLLGRLSRRRKRQRGLAIPEPQEIAPAPLAWPFFASEEGEGEYFAVQGHVTAMPPETLEALLLVAAAEDLDLVEAGWADPSPVPGLPPGEIRSFAGGGAWLTRLRGAAAQDGPRGKVVPLLGVAAAEASAADAAWPFFRKSGAYRYPARAESLARSYTARLDLRLAAMPPVEGPPTVLFLLPFLAVGGAERLLFDLLASWSGYRVLIVTVEPHAASLGQSVGRARQLTPQVYTLGDWLPRETHLGALFHLLRVYRVASLVSWNGTIFFYDAAPAIHAAFPELRILSQLFHHEGGFFSRNGQAARAAIDGHLAVNRAIAAALEAELAVPAEKIHLLHHGVELPPLPAAGEREERRRELRRRLGLPQDAVVAGTFIRLHPQKRPLDILELARRLAPRGVYFLLVGGGPLEAELEAELAARPLANLFRLPLVADARELYPAIDLCLLTSAYEGLPIFLLDGLARGIPCVSTAVGEVPELLAHGGGLCAPVGDLTALAAAITALLDPERRLREGEAGRRAVAENFSLPAFAAAYQRAIFPAEAARDRRAEIGKGPHPPAPLSADGEGGEPKMGGASPLPSPESAVISPARTLEREPEGRSPSGIGFSPLSPSAGRGGQGGEGPIPVASVVVPSYNHRRFLERTIGSALATSLPVEVVVVDDGSSDGSVELLASWAREEPRLRVVPQANAGAHAALNRGISLAASDLILILNSDDVFLPGRIETLAEAFAADVSLVFAGSWLEVIDTEGNVLGRKEGWRTLPPPWQKPDGLGRFGDPALALLESNYLSTTSNFAFRRGPAGAAPFKPLRYAHDWDFALERAAAGKFLFLETPLLQYRVHPSNTIKEGADAGRGAMHFEILWLLAAHARRICRARQEAHPGADLEAAIAALLPDFGRPDLLFTLLALRGAGAAPSPAYLALLDTAHPQRRRFVDQLAAAP